MALILTPEILANTYRLLSSTLPFRNWNLPDANDVLFKVVRDKRLRGWHRFVKGKHTIAVSRNVISHTLFLMMTMAHEMVHVYEGHVGIGREDVQHSRAFIKLADRVCAVHGFDPKMF